MWLIPFKTSSSAPSTSRESKSIDLGASAISNNVLSGFLLGAVDSTISSGVAQKVIAPPAGGSGNESDED